eukprot:3757247-Amphidinium_carterae.1
MAQSLTNLLGRTTILKLELLAFSACTTRRLPDRIGEITWRSQELKVAPSTIPTPQNISHRSRAIDSRQLDEAMQNRRHIDDTGLAAGHSTLQAAKYLCTS